MKLSDFDYTLPPHLIAQTPSLKRDESRLMIVNKNTQKIYHQTFNDILEFIPPHSVLVLNDTKVFNSRLFGYKKTGARIEMFLLKQIDQTKWSCLLRPAKRVAVGDSIMVSESFSATVLAKEPEIILDFTFNGNFFDLLDTYGEPPLPPYIKPSNPNEFKDRYQTVYANQSGSVAAPTAGLHFSKALLNQIKSAGIPTEYITLHVGYGTFNTVTSSSIKDHTMHAESYSITPDTAKRLQSYHHEGKTFVCVGTTSTRTIESAFMNFHDFLPGKFESDLFIYPGYSFKRVNSIVTNFHLPKSTLFMLVSAFAGLPLIKKAYKEAVDNNYRFYSFGDAMFLL
ncbi:tRNA preQ1(34) S-adenosylmethionine ribosyltransferase-isomerase QueA [bacterium]|nr:tRNA preQ1(34) S-adenosylmethionine ribosyltransferase-isomerase QueA [bacterium]